MINIIPFVHEGLGNSSYLVGLNGGEAVLFDPDRSAGRYLEVAKARGWRITSVIETHLHADFVSGAREIAYASGARVLLPAGSECRFSHQPVAGGERIQLGGVEIEAVASPGHTPEHLSYVLRAELNEPALFSGGALIVGGAARTDLISAEQTDALTRAQYRTLREAFSSLPDETVLYPTHGGGSFCSTGGGGERVSTLANERATNPVMSFDDEEEFTRWFPTTFPAVPSYFSRMRPINQQGPRLRHEIAVPPALSPAAFDEARQHALVVDARSVEAYASAHVPGSLSNTLRDAYAIWLGWLALPETPLLFVLDGLPVERVMEESLLVGYERFAGWLEGGMEAWTAAEKPVARSALVEAKEARRALIDGAAVLDVREPDEFDSGHIEGAVHMPLGDIAANIDTLPRDRPIVIYCGHGERAASAVSMLERAGFESLLNLKGGFGGWREAGLPVS